MQEIVDDFEVTRDTADDENDTEIDIQWVIDLVDCSGSILKEITGDECPLLITCATAFLRVVLKKIAKGIHAHKRSILLMHTNVKFLDSFIETLDTALVQHIASMFNSDLPKITSLKHFLLKEIRQYTSLKETKQLCKEIAAESIFSWAGMMNTVALTNSHLTELQGNLSGETKRSPDYKLTPLLFMNTILTLMQP